MNLSSTAIRLLRIGLALIVTGLAAHARAQSTLIVGPNGPYKTIQSALVAAVSKDEVRVSAGVYPERINFLGKSVRVVAVGTRAENSHVIDGKGRSNRGAGSVVTFAKGEGRGAVLEGFTIFDGSGFPGGPGGIQVHRSSPTIRHCWIVGNRGGHAETGGGDGGIGVSQGLPVIEHCTFQGNVGGNAASRSLSYGAGRGGGGGLGIQNNILGSFEVRDCRFDGNTGGSGWARVRWGQAFPNQGGGAIDLIWGSQPSTMVKLLVSGTTFIGNRGAAYTGAIDVWSPNNRIQIEVLDCVFRRNAIGALSSSTPSPSREELWRVSRTLFLGNGGLATISSTRTNGASWAVTDCAFVGNHDLAFLGLSPGSFDRCVFFGHVLGSNPVLVASSAYSRNSIFWGNNQRKPGSSVKSCCVEGGSTGGGNITSNPRFVRDPSPGLDQKWGTQDDDYGDLRLRPDSPCIDAGDPATRPVGQDFWGMPRLLDGKLDGVMRVDMGAHEFGHVRLDLTTPASNQARLSMTGTAKMPVVLAIGSPSATGLMLAPLGAFYLNPVQPLIVTPAGNLPQTISWTYPRGSYEIAVQAVALGGKGGTLSNPQTLTVR
jgi:hypothetical protein